MAEKSKKITVLLEPSEFQQFDRFCRVRGFKKSTLLVRLIREFLERDMVAENGPIPVFDEKSANRNSNDEIAKKPSV